VKGAGAVKRTVPVRIQGQEFRVRSDGDAARVRRAAALVDDTMQRVRTRSGTVDTLDLAILAALNLAHRLLTRDETPALDAGPDLAPLIARIEAALAEEGPARAGA
jgi:cell division protein ZapA (FtsZ GTPase activity inhibitor)